MSLERSSREARKIRATLRSRLSLKQLHERIDFDIDVVQKVIDALNAGKTIIGLPEATTIEDIEVQEVRIVDEDSNPDR